MLLLGMLSVIFVITENFNVFWTGPNFDEIDVVTECLRIDVLLMPLNDNFSSFSSNPKRLAKEELMKFTLLAESKSARQDKKFPLASSTSNTTVEKIVSSCANAVKV